MNVVDLVSSSSEDDDDDVTTATTITTLTDHNGLSLQRRGRPRLTPIRFTAVTTDPFHCFDGKLFFIIRGRPAAKKRPGVGYQHGQRYNSTAALEREFKDVVYKLFRYKDVNPQFGSSFTSSTKRRKNVSSSF